jgi:3-hydroxymyristoyl/3-hydroxydecanoyl-(acyl carrier protein) dehydratase
MMIHVDVLNNRGDFWKMRGVARVNGEDVAEATLMCKMIDRDAAPPAEATKK